MKSCGLCKRTDITLTEHDQVSNKLNNLNIEEFERVMTDMGVADHWESVIVCKECLDYYL